MSVSAELENSAFSPLVHHPGHPTLLRSIHCPGLLPQQRLHSGPLSPSHPQVAALSLPLKQPAVCQGGVGFIASTILLFQIQRTWKYPRFNLRKIAVPPAPPLPNLWPGSCHPVSRRGGELLTMFESFLVQVRVRGGFPTQTQVRVTSEPMSVVVGLGSTTIRGATEVERDKQIIRVLLSSGPGAGGGNSSPPPALPPLVSPRPHRASPTPLQVLKSPCPCSYSQWTLTNVLTLVLPTLLWTSQDTGSVKKE